jgi:hypothetical protein
MAKPATGSTGESFRKRERGMPGNRAERIKRLENNILVVRDIQDFAEQRLLRMRFMNARLT